jgi:hypothetical protein
MKHDLPKEFEDTIKQACDDFEKQNGITIKPKMLIDLAFKSLADKNSSYFTELARKDFLQRLKSPIKTSTE